MRKVLVLALGNVLAGDDAVGHAVLAALADDAEVNARADLVEAGTDLLRHAPLMPGRRRIIIVDAALTEGADTRVEARPHPLPPAERRASAHALDPVGSLDLLRLLHPAIEAVDTWWLLVDVPGLALRHGLSGAARQRVPEAALRLRELILDAR